MVRKKMTFILKGMLMLTGEAIQMEGNLNRDMYFLCVEE